MAGLKKIPLIGGLLISGNVICNQRNRIVKRCNIELLIKVDLTHWFGIGVTWPRLECRRPGRGCGCRSQQTLQQTSLKRVALDGLEPGTVGNKMIGVPTKETCASSRCQCSNIQRRRLVPDNRIETGAKSLDSLGCSHRSTRWLMYKLGTTIVSSPLKQFGQEAVRSKAGREAVVETKARGTLLQEGSEGTPNKWMQTPHKLLQVVSCM